MFDPRGGREGTKGVVASLLAVDLQDVLMQVQKAVAYLSAHVSPPPLAFEIFFYSTHLLHRETSSLRDDIVG